MKLIDSFLYVLITEYQHIFMQCWRNGIVKFSASNCELNIFAS